MCPKSSSGWFLLGLVVSVVAVTAWWLQLNEDRQRFFKNILRQLPDLPARYSV